MSIRSLKGTTIFKAACGIALAVPLIIAGGALPAGATSSTFTSPDPCSSLINEGICISGINVDYSSTTVSLSVTVGHATDPTTDPNWDPANDGNNFTGIAWSIFDGSDTSADWLALAYDVDNSSGPPTFTGGIGTFDSSTPTCAGPGTVTATFDVSADTYGLSFPASCIGNPASFSVVAGWVYDDQGTVIEAPIEPSNQPTCCTVTPDTAAPPTTTTPPTGTTTTTPPAPPGHGYWLVGADGGIFAFGGAQFHGSTGGITLNRPIVGMVSTPDHGGYWLDAADGGVFAFGDTTYYGSVPGLGYAPAGTSGPGKHLNAPIVGMVPTTDDQGYFMVGADGGVFTFGDARFEGSCPGIGGCSGTAVAVMPDATGNGYWLVTSTGHVYNFGDAPDYGQAPPEFILVTSAVRTPDGRGYWLLYANGAIVPFGDATFYGSPRGAFGGKNPATAIIATSSGEGYWVAGSNGNVDQYGDAPALGTLLGTRLAAPIVAGTGW